MFKWMKKQFAPQKNRRGFVRGGIPGVFEWSVPPGWETGSVIKHWNAMASLEAERRVQVEQQRQILDEMTSQSQQLASDLGEEY